MTKNFQKSISLITAFLFTFSSVAFAAPSSVTPSSLPSQQNFWQVQIPSDLGSVETTFAGNKGPSFFHIQTAHGSYEAQKSIHRILNHIKETDGLDLVLIEGNTNEILPETLKFFPGEPEKTMKAAELLTRRGYIEGEELFLLENQDVKAFGIEDESVYLENASKLVEVVSHQNVTLGFVNDLRQELVSLQSGINPKLRDFLRDRQSFESEAFTFEAYLNALKKHAMEVGVNLDEPSSHQFQYPNLVRLGILNALQEGLKGVQGFEFASDSVSSAAEKLQTALESPELLQELPAESLQRLIEWVEYENRDFFKENPDVRKIVAFHLLQKEIDAVKVFSEVENLENLIVEKRALSEKERLVVKLANDLKLLGKLFSLKLTPDEYVEFLSGDLKAPTSLFEQFESMGAEAFLFTHKQLADLDKIYFEALSFYELAKKRDAIMLENIGKRVKAFNSVLTTQSPQRDLKVAIITGGFHAEPFKKHFEDQKSNYVLISPRVTQIDSEEGTSYLKSIFLQAKNSEEAVVTASTLKQGALGALYQDPKKIPGFVRALEAEAEGVTGEERQFLLAVAAHFDAVYNLSVSDRAPDSAEELLSQLGETTDLATDAFVQFSVEPEAEEPPVSRLESVETVRAENRILRTIKLYIHLAIYALFGISVLVPQNATAQQLAKPQAPAVVDPAITQKIKALERKMLGLGVYNYNQSDVDELVGFGLAGVPTLIKYFNELKAPRTDQDQQFQMNLILRISGVIQGNLQGVSPDVAVEYTRALLAKYEDFNETNRSTVDLSLMVLAEKFREDNIYGDALRPEIEGLLKSREVAVKKIAIKLLGYSGNATSAELLLKLGRKLIGDGISYGTDNRAFLDEIYKSLRMVLGSARTKAAIVTTAELGEKVHAELSRHLDDLIKLESFDLAREVLDLLAKLDTRRSLGTLFNLAVAGKDGVSINAVATLSQYLKTSTNEANKALVIDQLLLKVNKGEIKSLVIRGLLMEHSPKRLNEQAQLSESEMIRYHGLKINSRLSNSELMRSLGFLHRNKKFGESMVVDIVGGALLSDLYVASSQASERTNLLNFLSDLGADTKSQANRSKVILFFDRYIERMKEIKSFVEFIRQKKDDAVRKIPTELSFLKDENIEAEPSPVATQPVRLPADILKGVNEVKGFEPKDPNSSAEQMVQITKDLLALPMSNEIRAEVLFRILSKNKSGQHGHKFRAFIYKYAGEWAATITEVEHKRKVIAGLKQEQINQSGVAILVRMTQEQIDKIIETFPAEPTWQQENTKDFFEGLSGVAESDVADAGAFLKSEKGKDFAKSLASWLKVSDEIKTLYVQAVQQFLSAEENKDKAHVRMATVLTVGSVILYSDVDPSIRGELATVLGFTEVSEADARVKGMIGHVLRAHKKNKEAADASKPKVDRTGAFNDALEGQLRDLEEFLQGLERGVISVPVEWPGGRQERVQVVLKGTETDEELAPLIAASLGLSEGEKRSEVRLSSGVSASSLTAVLEASQKAQIKAYGEAVLRVIETVREGILPSAWADVLEANSDAERVITEAIFGNEKEMAPAEFTFEAYEDLLSEAGIKMTDAEKQASFSAAATAVDVLLTSSEERSIRIDLTSLIKGAEVALDPESVVSDVINAVLSVVTANPNLSFELVIPESLSKEARKMISVAKATNGIGRGDEVGEILVSPLLFAPKIDLIVAERGSVDADAQFHSTVAINGEPLDLGQKEGAPIEAIVNGAVAAMLGEDLVDALGKKGQAYHYLSKAHAIGFEIAFAAMLSARKALATSA